MELHMVHLNTDPNVTNRIAVVGFLYKIGRPDRFLSKVINWNKKVATLWIFCRIAFSKMIWENGINCWQLMRSISSMIDKKDEERTLGMIDPNDIKLRSKRYYRYMGSLTVPPCTEGVIWTINKKVMKLLYLSIIRSPSQCKIGLIYF